VVINGVTDSNLRFVVEVATPALERRRVSVYGVLPEDRRLMATSIGEIADAANGQFLTHADKRDELVENLTVGAMGIEEARARLSRIPNKAVITGGDRTDMIAVALDCSARLIILTGDLMPSRHILQRAADMGVPWCWSRTIRFKRSSASSVSLARGGWLKRKSWLASAHCCLTISTTSGCTSGSV